MLCAVDGSASITFDKLHQCRGYNSEGIVSTQSRVSYSGKLEADLLVKKKTPQKTNSDLNEVHLSLTPISPLVELLLFLLPKIK